MCDDHQRHGPRHGGGLDSRTRIDFERKAANDDFAGILAGAVHATAPKPEPKKAKEGTSELDKPEEKAKDDDDTKRVKRSRVRRRTAPTRRATRPKS